MVIPTDTEQLKCKGIIDAAKMTYGELGGKARGMMKDLALGVLSKLVVGEERMIEKNGITIYTKMYVISEQVYY